jgi:hypothetical protein
VTVVAYVPDLMDRSKVSSVGADVRFAPSPAQLPALIQEAGPSVVVVDLSRPGVLDVLPQLGEVRVIGFGSHVDRDLLEAARAAGCTEVLARSAFFSRLPGLLA